LDKCKDKFLRKFIVVGGIFLNSKFKKTEPFHDSQAERKAEHSCRGIDTSVLKLRKIQAAESGLFV